MIVNQILEILINEQVSEEFMSRLNQSNIKDKSLNQLFSQLYEKDEPFFKAFVAFLESFTEFNFQQAIKYIETLNSFEFQKKKALLWS